MAVIFKSNTSSPKGVEAGGNYCNTVKKASRHARKAVAPVIPLDQPGRLRIAHLQYLFSISHATVYKRIEQKAIPEPDGYDLKNRPKGKQGRPYWKTATIRPLLEE